MTGAFLVAGVFFTLNFALGVSLQLGARWHLPLVHHGLYFATCASLTLALLLALRAPTPWWPYAALLGALLLVPRTHPGRADHAVLASIIALGFALTAWRTL